MYKNYKILILAIILCLPQLISSQVWGDISFGRGYLPRTLFSDTPSSKLYVGGNFLNINSSITSGVATFDNVNGWQPCGGVIGNVGSIVKFNNELFVGTQNGVFRLNGAKWDTIGLNDVGYVQTLYVYNNELYAGGVYNKMDTAVSHGLTKWDGVSWKQVGNYKKICHGAAYSLIGFNGELYAFGNITDSLGVPMSVAKYNGITWSRVTNAFNGNMDEIGSSVIYNNELYVGGTFGKCYGSTFNFIAKYDGTTWSDVGFNGLTGITPSSNGQVSDIKVIDGKLYAVGVFSYADNIPAQYIATWDGIKWCGYNYSSGTGFDNTINNIVKANDTIYIAGGFKKFNNDSIFSVAKWIGGSYTNSCSSPLGVNEVKINSNISVYPNPATSILNITDEQNELQGATIEIINYLGQPVLSLPYSTQIDVLSLAKGYYLLTITTPRNQVFHSKFIKE